MRVRKLEGDPRWEHGDPPKGNANFGWLQHMLYHLAPKGSMALLLANGSMSSNTKGENEIRETIVKADLVECMVALATCSRPVATSEPKRWKTTAFPSPKRWRA